MPQSVPAHACNFRFFVFLSCTGALYQWVADYRDRSMNPPPGLLVNVDGFTMHLYCVGQGSPTVVLDSGIGDSWLSWRKVQPEVAQFTRVCSYDRAGMGWSDKSPNPRTSNFIAIELHTVLKNASILLPFGPCSAVLIVDCNRGANILPNIRLGMNAWHKFGLREC